MPARQRTNFTKKVKKAAEARAKGRCEARIPGKGRCPFPIPPGGRIFDHIIADALYGPATLENCQVICKGCDRAKYARDRAAIDEARRREERHLGLRSPRQVLAGSILSPVSRSFGVTRSRATGKVLSRPASIDVREL